MTVRFYASFLIAQLHAFPCALNVATDTYKTYTPGKWQATGFRVSCSYDIFDFMMVSVPKQPLQMHDITADIWIRSFNTKIA